MALETSTIKLWRSTPVAIEKTASINTVDLPREAILTSARQGLTEAITYLELGRADYVGIPDYSSHCVIDFIGSKVTPVPTRFLPSQFSSAILIYDQWGWQKSLAARLEVKKIFPNAKVIWDRVDSLPKSFEQTARAEEDEADFQVFSLSKTLGAGGGGLVWISRHGWLERRAYADTEFVIALNRLLEDFQHQQRSKDMIDRFFRNECDCHPPLLVHWLKTSNVDQAAKTEHHLRREKLEHCFRHLPPDAFPEWMLVQIEKGDMPAPGILPVCIRKAYESVQTEVERIFQVEVAIYHFNFSDNYLNQEWTKVLAVPIHSEIEMSLFEEILKYIVKGN